jgi:histone acetyltransferase (RNA polymerase elongator complex component)
MNKLTVPFFIRHRGCPHRCVFCDQEKISGSTGDLPRETDIVEKVSGYGKTCVRESLEVAFFGGSFTSLSMECQEQLLRPLQPLLKSGEVSSVRISTRPDSVDSHVAAYLKNMGVATVELGVQSMDDNVLELSGRGHGSREVESAVSCLKYAGMAVGIQLMPGLPGDSPEKSLDSLRRVLALKPDFLRIYPTVVISGTALEELYVSGSYRPMTLDGAVGLCKVMLHESLRSGIPVIRMGLQPTDELRKPGVIVAGPWHPAFRQLVEAELCFDLLACVIGESSRHGDEVTVHCAPARISDVIGQKKTNVERLSRQFGVKLAAVNPEPGMSPMELSVVFDGRARTGNMLKDLNYYGR